MFDRASVAPKGKHGAILISSRTGRIELDLVNSPRSSTSIDVACSRDSCRCGWRCIIFNFSRIMSSVAATDIPLTTVFEPPASCTDVITRAGDIFWQGGRQQTGDPDCYPASFYSITGSYYSPGVCPMGWTSAGAFFTPNSVTDAVCCPE
jgi:hypothetical protein